MSDFRKRCVEHRDKMEDTRLPKEALQYK